MTDPTRPAPGERRRIEALRRLGVEHAGELTELAAPLRLLARAVAADDAVLVVAAGPRPSGSGPPDEPPGDFRADLRGDAVRAAERRRLADVAVEADDGRAHAVLEEGDATATLAAAVVTAPDGVPVGAIVACWAGARPLDDATWELLAASAGHVAFVLELRARAGAYRRFLELSPDPVLVLDGDGRVEQANPAVRALLGFADDVDAPDDLVGAPFLDRVVRRDRARVTSELARVLFVRRHAPPIDVELLAADGRVVPCSVSAGHLRGTPRHLQLVVHDLTDRLRDEEERTRLSEQLARAQRLDAVGQIASGLAHDLNNLLVVMVSNLTLAEESLDAALDPDGPGDVTAVREDLAEVGTAVDRAVALTGKLLQLARNDEVARGPADVTEVVAAVRRLVVRSLPAGVMLEVAAPDAPVWAAADPVHLERVLLNLVLNARDAIEGAGTIRVEVEAVDAASAGTPGRRREDAEAVGAGPCVRVGVRDDGVGMDERTLARAFEPLFSTKTDRGGSGLGLATVLAFTDEVDGTAEIASRPGEGTTVTVTIPQHVPEPSAPPVALDADAPAAGARVLLVEPGERTRRVIATMLQGAGYQVTPVGSGEDALPLVRAGEVDLLVTELSLPGISGVRLLDALRAQGGQARAVALASVDAPRTLEGTPVLVKPFSHTRLLRTVERVLAGR